MKWSCDKCQSFNVEYFTILSEDYKKRYTCYRCLDCKHEAVRLVENLEEEEE